MGFPGPALLEVVTYVSLSCMSQVAEMVDVILHWYAEVYVPFLCFIGIAPVWVINMPAVEGPFISVTGAGIGHCADPLAREQFNR